jgi:hypothetical protein
MWKFSKVKKIKYQKTISVILAVLLIFQFVLPIQVLAATRSYDFTTSSDYTFDNTKISFSAGQAQLKATTTPSWYNASWTKRKVVTIDNTGNSSTLTNYQVQVSVTYDSDMQADFDDIRFTDNDGTTLIDHWLETKTDSTSATFWVEVPSIPASSNKTIYMYYGNSGASTASVFSGVFSQGSDFSSNFGTLTQKVAGNGTAEVLPLRDINSTQAYRAWTRSENPILQASDLGNPNFDYVRELTLLRDTNNLAVKEGGKYIGYFAARNGTTGVMDSYRTESNNLTSWTNFQPAVVHGQAGLDSISASVSSVMKFSPTDYRMWYWARESFPGVYDATIAFATSTDGINWTKQGVAVNKNLLNVAGTSKAMGVPWVYHLSNGTYVLLVEAYGSDDPEWRIFGFTSSDALTWTVINSGNAILNLGITNAWDDASVANPKLMELSDGTLVIEYNGADTAVNNFQLGYATSSSITGTFSRNISNPMIGISNPTDNYGVETSHWSLDETGNNWIHFHQEFSGTSATAKIYKSDPILAQGALLQGNVDSDSAFLGTTLSSSLFVARNKTYMGSTRDDSGTSPLILALWDSVSVPNSNISTNLQSIRRLEIVRQAYGRTAKGDIYIFYWDASGTRQSWDGSSWTTTATSIVTDYERPIFAQITDDGTNYAISVRYADSVGGAIATATIVKSSVKAFSNGRVLLVGDPFTEAWKGQLFVESMLVRSYTSPEPVATFGSEVTLYDNNNPTLQPISAITFTALSAFTETATKNSGEIKYQISNDGGTIWYWYNSGWTTTSAGYTEANSASDINSNIATFPVGSGQFLFKAYLHSDGAQLVQLDNIDLTYINDTTGPTGTISNGNGTPTNDTTPTFNLTIADAGIGITGAQMQFSCDNSTWSTWESYATPKTDFNIRTGAGCTDVDGSKTIYVEYKDSLGNIGSSYNTGAFTLDTVSSNAALSGTPASITNSASASITVAGTDITTYKYKIDSGAYGAETPIATLISLSSLSDASHTLSVIGKDSAGNWQAEGSTTTYTWTVDTTVPAVTFIIPATSDSLTVSFTSFSATDANTITGYLVNETATIPAIDDVGWAGTAQTQYVFTTEGAKTLYAWAKDEAGNISTSGSGAVTVTLPTPAVSHSGGGGCYGCYVNPAIPSGGFKMSINGGASTAPNRNVFLGFNAGADIKKMAISMTGDFTDASQENYIASKQWDLCSKLGGAVKNPTCLDGQYTVYAKFYTAWGRTSDPAIASSTITLKSGYAEENLQKYTNLPFTNPFTKYLQYRQTNTDIKRLQIFLNSDPDTKVADSGAGSPGKETNFFGLLTKKAVIKFQEKYAKDILSPWGFVKGTGYVGKTTLAKINELMGNK